MNSNDKKKNDNNNDNTKKEINKNEILINSKINVNSLENINFKEQNKTIHHKNKPTLSPSTSESISYKWKEDNSSYVYKNK